MKDFMEGLGLRQVTDLPKDKQATAIIFLSEIRYLIQEGVIAESQSLFIKQYYLKRHAAAMAVPAMVLSETTDGGTKRRGPYKKKAAKKK